jgi:hypothetical protein
VTDAMAEALELDDIQHILLTRTPAITGRYEFLTFDTPAGGRAWLSELMDKVQSAADVQATMDSSDRWVTLASTWTGLRALGVPEDALASFPDAFREGMAARAGILGDTGTSADLHAIAILFSRTDEQCRRSIAEHDKLLARLPRHPRRAAIPRTRWRRCGWPLSQQRRGGGIPRRKESHLPRRVPQDVQRAALPVLG